MKKISWRTLSQYSDGTLPPDDEARRAIENGDAGAEIRRALDDLTAIKDALGKAKPLPENPYFWEQLQSRLDGEHTATRRNRIPPAYRPAIVALSVIAVFAAGSGLYLKRDDIARYFSRTGEQVVSAYEDIPLRSWVMPLFAKTSKDKALEFAMFGTLPIDEQNNTVLHVDNTVRQGYRIELGSAPPRTAKRVTAEDLYREVQATGAQRRLIDSVLHYAQRQIESSVLMDGGRAVAINPSLTRLNTAILTTLATSLEPPQRIRLAKFMDDYEAPYTVIAEPAAPPIPPDVLLRRLRSIPEPRQYMVFQGNNIQMRSVGVNIDSLRVVMEQQVDQSRAMAARNYELAVRLTAIGKTIEDRAKRTQQEAEGRSNAAVHVYADSGMVGIRIRTGDRDTHTGNPVLSIRPRAWIERMPVPPRVPKTVRVRVFENSDSSAHIELQLDSILKEAFENIPDFELDTDIEREFREETPTPPPPPPPRAAPVKKKSAYHYYYQEETPVRKRSDGPMNFLDAPAGDSSAVGRILREHSIIVFRSDSAAGMSFPHPPLPPSFRDSSSAPASPARPGSGVPPVRVIEL